MFLKKKINKDKTNILDVAEYIIYKFNAKHEKIFQNKLQYMLFYTEIFYMDKYQKDFLFKEETYCYSYSPVYKEVYNKYKIFKDLPLEATTDPKIPDSQIKSIIDEVYQMINKYNILNLISLYYRFLKYNNIEIDFNKKINKKLFIDFVTKRVI